MGVSVGLIFSSMSKWTAIFWGCALLQWGLNTLCPAKVRVQPLGYMGWVFREGLRDMWRSYHWRRCGFLNANTCQLPSSKMRFQPLRYLDMCIIHGFVYWIPSTNHAFFNTMGHPIPFERLLRLITCPVPFGNYPKSYQMCGKIHKSIKSEGCQPLEYMQFW